MNVLFTGLNGGHFEHTQVWCMLGQHVSQHHGHQWMIFNQKYSVGVHSATSQFVCQK